MKASAEEFSTVGFAFVGRPYEDMDCQEFVERCLVFVGIKKDLKGSNAWFRAMTWTGSPEECLRKFGSIPRGAFLFIHAFDGGERKRGYVDGKGNASHIGIKTGTGEGALHSSQSRGGVCESKFRDKTIKNGGWNMIGLWADGFTYGEKIDRILAGSSSAEDIPEPDAGREAKTMYNATVSGGNPDAPLNLRKTKGGDLLDYIPQGDTVTVLKDDGKWSKVKWKGKTGYIVSEYVHPEGEEQTEDAPFELEPADEGETVTLALTLTRGKAEILLPILDELVEQLVRQVGRG